MNAFNLRNKCELNNFKDNDIQLYKVLRRMWATSCFRVLSSILGKFAVV